MNFILLKHNNKRVLKIRLDSEINNILIIIIKYIAMILINWSDWLCNIWNDILNLVIECLLINSHVIFFTILI